MVRTLKQMFSKTKQLVPEFCGITIRCPISNAERPIEKISFRCGGELLGKNTDNQKPCENHTQPLTFDEMKAGFRITGSDHRAPTQLLRTPLRLPQRLTAEARDLVLEELKAARCALSGHPFFSTCNCSGIEHRIYFDISDIICLTGRVQSGKTVYFRALQYFFTNQYIVGYDMPVLLGPYETSVRVKSDLRIMLESKILPSATAPGENMEIRFVIGPGNKGWPLRPINLLSYDTSGEILEDMSLIQTNFGFFAFSDSLILFVDPYNIPELANKCRSYGLGIHQERHNSAVVKNMKDNLDDLILFLKDRVFTQEVKFPMNLAVAVTKCDEYMHLFDEELKTLLDQVHSSNALKPNLEPLDKISDCFKKWLSQFENPQISVVDAFMKQAKGKFKNVGYFPISALGTRAYKETTSGTQETKSSRRIFEEVESLDASQGEAPVASSAMAAESIVSNAPKIVLKYEGQLNPRYMDYPILWLHQKRQKK